MLFLSRVGCSATLTPAGITSENTEPLPFLLVAVTRPPSSSANCLVIARPRPIPAVPEGVASVGLCEWLEHVCQLFRGDANSSVFDIEADVWLIVLVLQRDLQIDLQIDMALLREFDGIECKIDQTLLQSVGIGANGYAIRYGNARGMIRLQ